MSKFYNFIKIIINKIYDIRFLVIVVIFGFFVILIIFFKILVLKNFNFYILKKDKIKIFKIFLKI